MLDRRCAIKGCCEIFEEGVQCDLSIAVEGGGEAMRVCLQSYSVASGSGVGLCESGVMTGCYCMFTQ